MPQYIVQCVCGKKTGVPGSFFDKGKAKAANCVVCGRALCMNVKQKLKAPPQVEVEYDYLKVG